jgi:hypothetical protein
MTRKAVLTFVFLFALTGIFSYAQQGLKPSASLTLSGDIVGLVSCAGGSALVAASKSAEGTTLQVINTFSKEIVASASVRDSQSQRAGGQSRLRYGVRR